MLNHQDRRHAWLPSVSVYRIGALCGWGLLLFAQSGFAAPPVLNYLYPAGAQRGNTVKVTASGTFPKWPAEILCDAPHVKFSALEKKGELEVVVAPEAYPGIYLVRVKGEEGVSALRPFLVGVLPELMEKEPNNRLSEAPLLAESSVVNGKLAKSGDVDGWRMTLKKGQTMVCSAEARHRLGAAMDMVLQVCDSAGFVLAQNDDEIGIDPQIVFPAPRDGEYLVRVFAFPETPNSTIGFAGADTFVYRLTISTAPFVDHCLPLAISKSDPNVMLRGWNLTDDQTSKPQRYLLHGDELTPGESVQFAEAESGRSLFLPIAENTYLHDAKKPAAEVPVPVAISGCLEQPGAVHRYQFAATKGKAVVGRVESFSLGFALDPVLEVYDKEGKRLAQSDDISRQERDSLVTFRPPADGSYELLVKDAHDQGGLRYAYRLLLDSPAPDFRLTTTQDVYELKVGTPLEITVNIERLGGFSDPIQIVAADLPEGVTATEAESSKGATAKSVKLKLESKNPHAPLQFTIHGTAKEHKRTARFSNTPTGMPLSQLWLTTLK